MIKNARILVKGIKKIFGMELDNLLLVISEHCRLQRGVIG